MKKIINSCVVVLLASNMLLTTTLPVYGITVNENEGDAQQGTEFQNELEASTSVEDLTNNSQLLSQEDLVEIEKTGTETSTEVTTEATETIDSESLDIDSETGSSNELEAESEAKKETEEPVIRINETIKYVTIINNSAKIWSDKIGVEELGTTAEMYEKTYVSKDSKIVDDVEYYSLYNQKNGNTDTFIGYIQSDAIRVAVSAQGEYFSYQTYVTVTNNSEVTYSNFSWKQRGTTKDMVNKTYFARGKYNHVNGQTYLSLFDNKGDWFGYLLETATKKAAGRQGIYQSFGDYVTVVNKNYAIYRNFSWTVLGKTSDVENVTFQARGKYQHFNGMTYLSLYDSKGNWYGYVNKNATKAGANQQGAYQAYGKYVTITNKNYSSYRNFSWSELVKTADMVGKTFHARGKYNHFNGMAYLSLFDEKGTWYGYLNENATQLGNGRQGAYQAYGKFVTVTNGNYQQYRNFSWTPFNHSETVVGKTYQARGKYQHFNGSIYLSLFDKDGKWYGYINQNATQLGNGREGAYQAFNRHVILNTNNYSMWNNFNWDLRQLSNSNYKKGLIARGKYVHFNGGTYYSVFNGVGEWQGYINANGTSLVSSQIIPTTYYSQMAIGAWNGCAATALYTALKAKGYAGNVSLVNFINGLPLSNDNPDVGQIGNPWGTTPFKRVISPVGLNKYARKYTSNTEILTGSSIDKVITEINSGNPVLFWGFIRMEQAGRVTNPQHVMVAKGYKVVGNKEYILIQDPGSYSATDRWALHWYEKNAFDKYLTEKQRKMMVIR